MTMSGTIVNGHVRLDQPSGLPEGTRVRLLADSCSEEWDVLPFPPDQETQAEVLSSLRESILDPESVDARQFMKELAIKHGLPLMPGE
jgi:hypothetical protein